MSKLPGMRIALVANPASGASDDNEHAAAALREAGATVELVGLDDFCDGPNRIDDDRLATLAERLDGTDRVVVAGGDGSVGAAAVLARRQALPLAVIPAGTANDFARWLGVPLDIEEAALLAADPAANTTPVELADAGGRPFVNAASAGLSVDAARRARGLKKLLGPLAYPLGAMRAGLTGRPLSAVVRCDGSEVFDGRAWQIVVAATGAFGGGSQTGGVDPEDLRLDVAIVEAGARIKLVKRAWAMRNARLVDEEDVPHYRGRVVEIDLGVGAGTFNVDGEVLQGVKRFAVTGMLDAVVPS